MTIKYEKQNEVERHQVQDMRKKESVRHAERKKERYLQKKDKTREILVKQGVFRCAAITRYKCFLSVFCFSLPR